MTGPARPGRGWGRPEGGDDPVLRVVAVVGTAVMAGSIGQLLAGLLGWSSGPGALAGVAIGAVAALLVTGTALASTVCAMVVMAVFLHVRIAGPLPGLFVGPVGTAALVALTVVLLVVGDRLATDSVPVMRGSTVAPRRGVLTSSVVSLVAVGFLAVLIAPSALRLVSRSTTPGEGPRLESITGGAAPLLASTQLDMTDRPDLTDSVVFTVDADRATFWRGQTYDRWDGRRWHQTRTRRSPLAPGGQVIAGAEDLGASGSDRLVQRIRLEAGYSDVIFAAASAVSVDAPVDVAQGADSTLVAASKPLGRGATYTVISRRHPLDEATLRAVDGPVPTEVAALYAAEPVATDRVRQAARAAVAGQTNTYDRVRALERWMGRTTRYSLDAPLSPEGVDVVDHFLFDSREGWCEQVASALVVMARINQIPARLVTGYAPGEARALTGTYVVRERDAHAWAEVWFPEVGWVPFDPTASVPLAGADRADPAAGSWAVEHAVELIIGAGVAVLAGWATLRGVRWLLARRRERPVGWAAVTSDRLDRLGSAMDRPRLPGETATVYAEALGRRLSDRELARVGSVVDDVTYAPEAPDALARQSVDAVLAAAESRAVGSDRGPG